MIPTKQVLVTGLHEHWVAPRGVQFKFLEVLEFKRLSFPKEIWGRMASAPFHWVIFTSPRAVRFWTEALLEEGIDFPIETRVACIGEKTKEAALMDGYTPDFYPSEPGTETFLEEFKSFVSVNPKTTVLLPGSAISRPLLRESLTQLGCETVFIPLYETVAKENVGEIITVADLNTASLFLFTSPSSVEAVLSSISLPKSLKVAAIGSFTKESLAKRGYPDSKVLNEGNEERVGELLC